MIAQTITQKIADALKAKDEVRLSTYRMLSSAFNYEKIAKQHDLTDEEELAVIRKEVKKRKEAIDYFRQAQGKVTTSTEDEMREKKKREEEEMKLLQEFLPPEMTENELSDLISQAINKTGALGFKDMGKVIGMVMQNAKGRADGSKVSEIVKQKLS